MPSGQVEDEIAIKITYKEEIDKVICIERTNIYDGDAVFNLQVTDYLRQIQRPDIYPP